MFNSRTVAEITGHDVELIDMVLPELLAAMKPFPEFLSTQVMVAVIATASLECHFDARDSQALRFLESPYHEYTKKAGIDLFQDVDLAKDPVQGSKLLVRFMLEQNVTVWAGRGQWRKVREIIGGDKVKLDQFLKIVFDLLDAAYQGHT